jgi:hypothetical protein
MPQWQNQLHKVSTVNGEVDEDVRDEPAAVIVKLTMVPT